MSCLVVCPLFVPAVSVVGAALATIVIKLHLNTPTVYILPVLYLVCDIVYYLSPLQVVQLQVLWSVMKHAREPICLLVHSVFIAVATGRGRCSLGWHSYTAALTSLHAVASRTLQQEGARQSEQHR